jgi:hypothetical protein
MAWPFAMLLALLRSSATEHAKRNYLFLFCCFFGYSFITKLEASDIARYLDNFHLVHSEIQFGHTFIKHLQRLYVVENYTEPFNPIVTYCVAVFTDDQRLLMLVYGAFFGFYYSFNISWLMQVSFDKIGIGNQKLARSLFILFFLIVPVWEMNGIRMWVGINAFIYFTIRHFYLGKNLSPIVFVPMLYHSSFLLLSPIIYLGYIGLKPYKNVTWLFYLYLGVLILFYSGFKLQIVDIDLGGSSDALQNKLEGYNQDEDYFSDLSANAGPKGSWFLIFSETFRFYLLTLVKIQFVLLMFMKISKTRFSQLEKFLLLMGFVSYLIALHPAPSAQRYALISDALLIIYLIYENFRNPEILTLLYGKYVSIAVNMLILFNLVIEIRHGFDVLNYALFLGNPFTIAYFGNDTPLIDFYHALFGKFAG